MFKKFCGMFFNDLFIDLGMVNIFIYVCGQGIVLNELLVVVVCQDCVIGGICLVVVVGVEVKQMLGCILGYIIIICLMKDGVIVDFIYIEVMFKYFIKKVYKLCVLCLSLCVLVCVLVGLIQVECCVIKELVEEVGVCDVFLIEELMVVVIGVGMLVIEVCGLMVIDIGGGIIEVVVILFNGIVYLVLVCIGGDCFDEFIINYVCCNYGMLIGEVIVECIKVELGCVYLQVEVIEMEIFGCNFVEGVLKMIKISFNEVFEVLYELLLGIVSVVKLVLEQILLELCVDVVECGIVLIGGGVLLCDLDCLIFEEIGLYVQVVDDLLICVVCGGGCVLELVDMYGNEFFVLE